jgi:hypothetical protein
VDVIGAIKRVRHAAEIGEVTHPCRIPGEDPEPKIPGDEGEDTSEIQPAFVHFRNVTVSKFN